MTVPENVGFATVMIYNLEGKQMKNIQVNDRGKVSVKISGNELSAGMYLYALIADGKVVDTKRMILTRVADAPHQPFSKRHPEAETVPRQARAKDPVEVTQHEAKELTH